MSEARRHNCTLGAPTLPMGTEGDGSIWGERFGGKECLPALREEAAGLSSTRWSQDLVIPPLG